MKLDSQSIGRIVRFGFVGLVNTGMYYGVYLLLHPHLPYLAAHVCAFVSAMLVSYLLNCYVTFRVRPRWKTLALFPLSNLASFVIMTVGLRFAVGVLGLNETIAPLVVALVAVPVTYLVTHYILVGRLREPQLSDAAP